MNAELIQELQLMQNSRANKLAIDLSDRLQSSVDLVTEKVQSSISKRGNMLLLLEKRLSRSAFKKMKSKFFKF